jgi:hypothetical protein
MMPEVRFTVSPDDGHLEKELWLQLVKQVRSARCIHIRLSFITTCFKVLLAFIHEAVMYSVN